MNEEKSSCAVCKKDEDEVPVIQIKYRGSTMGICPAHMPVLIHNPDQLKGVIDNAENFTAG